MPKAYVEWHGVTCLKGMLARYANRREARNHALQIYDTLPMPKARFASTQGLGKEDRA